MNKEILLVDLDGVVSKTYGRKLCQKAKSLFNYDIRESDITSYELPSCTPLSYEQLAQLLNSPNYYYTAAPFKDARGELEALSRVFEQHIVTARPNNPIIRAQTLEWLIKHIIPFDAIHFSEHKKELAEKLRVRFAIEDSPLNAQGLATMCETVFLIDNIMNRSETMPSNVLRVKDLREVRRHLLGT